MPRLRCIALPPSMMEAPPHPDDSTLPVTRRAVGRGEFSLLIVAAIIVSVFGLLLLALEGWGGALERHRKQLRRVDHWIVVSRAFPPSGMNQHDWSQCLVGPHNALFNALDSQTIVPTYKIRELADHFDRTEAAQLNSLGGVLGFIDYLGEICPSARDYGPFEMLRASYPRVKPLRLVIDNTSK